MYCSYVSFVMGSAPDHRSSHLLRSLFVCGLHTPCAILFHTVFSLLTIHMGIMGPHTRIYPSLSPAHLNLSRLTADHTSHPQTASARSSGTTASASWTQETSPSSTRPRTSTSVAPLRAFSAECATARRSRSRISCMRRGRDLCEGACSRGWREGGEAGDT